MSILIFKALHIIGAVAWFAGLFYLVRIFVYHSEAKEKPEVERGVLIPQYILMESRAFNIIVRPGMMFTFTCGIAMLVINPVYLQQGWMHFKLGFLVLMLGYHIYCKKILNQLKDGTNTHTPVQFRMMNEVPTLFLIAIVTLAVFRANANAFYIFGALLVLAILFYIIIKKYKKHREKRSAEM